MIYADDLNAGAQASLCASQRLDVRLHSAWRGRIELTQMADAKIHPWLRSRMPPADVFGAAGCRNICSPDVDRTAGDRQPRRHRPAGVLNASPATRRSSDIRPRGRRNTAQVALRGRAIEAPDTARTARASRHGAHGSVGRMATPRQAREFVESAAMRSLRIAKRARTRRSAPGQGRAALAVFYELRQRRR